MKQRASTIESSGRMEEDMISALPDELLLNILFFLPTKDAVAAMILSKRWLSIWTILPQLEYKDGKIKCIWWFLEESIQHEKACLSERLVIKLGANPEVRDLKFKLSWFSDPTVFSNSVYICNKLVNLKISDKILVDLSSPACLPSLKMFSLHYVVYKDEYSLVGLLSGCHILETLFVDRHELDNVTKFRVKVPSLKNLWYSYYYETLGEDNVEDLERSLVINSASLRELFILDYSGNFCSTENMPCLEKAFIDVYQYLDDKFVTSLSSVMSLTLQLNIETVACCKASNFCQLIECELIPFEFDWLEPFMCLLQNSPKLKILKIDQSNEDFPLSFYRASSVPKCLSTHLEIFEWKEFGGRKGEKEVLRYILANSKCLKTVGISFNPTCSQKNRKKMRKELGSMARISESSQLLFSTQLKSFLSVEDE